MPETHRFGGPPSSPSFGLSLQSMRLKPQLTIVVIFATDGSHFARERLTAFTPWHLDAVSGNHPLHPSRAKGRIAGLFDHLVGAAKQGKRQADGERLGGLEVDYEFDLRRLLDRQIGGLLAF
jgi:hypothetical protein